MVEKAKAGVGRRSGSPVSVSLERCGDRWALLLIRDKMVRGYRTFKEFQESGEGIATNILSNRLDRLRAAGIVETEADERDGRKVIYRLTEKGIDLAPVMLELLLWASKWEETGAPCEVMAQMGANRGAVLEEVRRRWREGDPEPFLPAFRADSTSQCGSHVSSRHGAPTDPASQKRDVGHPGVGGRKKRIRKGD